MGKPTVPPFARIAGNVPDQHFRGITLPSEQFKSVQNQLVTPPLSGLIDLSTARSIAAGTALVVNVAGNSFYIDANTDVGNVQITFQDTSQQPQQQPMFVGPQFIAKIPFTRFLIQNTAQPAKFLRFFYGVDVDFSPGLNNQVVITGNTNVVDVGVTPGAQFISAVALGVGVPVNAIAAASNLNGYIYHGCILFCDGPNKTEASVLAKATAPASSVDGIVLKMLGVGTNVQAVGSAINPDYEIVGKRPFNVAAGLRLDAISVNAQATTRFITSYTLK
jgi:hypothetical protein